MSGIGMTSISWSLQCFLKIKLGSNFAANAVADDKSGVGDIPQNDLVLPRHLLRNPRKPWPLWNCNVGFKIENLFLFLFFFFFLVLFSLAFPGNQTSPSWIWERNSKFRERKALCSVCLVGFWRGFDSGGQIKLCFLFFEKPGAAGSVNGPGFF